MYRPTSASSIHSESSEGKSPAFVMLLEAMHVELWAAYTVVMNVHYILIMLVKVSFQYLIKLVISKINHSYKHIEGS